MTDKAKCTCDVGSDSDSDSIDMAKHADDCTRRLEWEETKAKSFMITHERVACSLHLSPFEASWPRGFASYATKAVQFIAGAPGIWAEALERARPSSCTAESKCASCRAADAGVALTSGLAPLCLMSSDMDPSHYALGLKDLEAVLDAKPVCCRVTPTDLARLYTQSGVGVLGRCKFCQKKSLGTPIKAMNLGRVDHACFKCMSTASRGDPTKQ